MVRLGFDELRFASMDAAPAVNPDLVAMLRGGGGGWQSGSVDQAMSDATTLSAMLDRDANGMIVHSPDIRETAREATAVPITPTRTMFVRNHIPAPQQALRPDIDPMRWPVSFDGVLVPLTLTLKDLLAFGTTNHTCVVQCPGNGRSFFPEPPAGTPWGVGGAACVTFTGVPLRLVIAGLGGGIDAPRFLTATGADPLPSQYAPERRVERSVPIHALKDALLAFAVNGEPLAVRHGGPLRLVVPGYYSVNFVKFVRRISLTSEESDADIQRTNYRVRPVGVAGDPSQPTLWELPAKSWIASAQAVAPRRIEVKGVAFGGTSAPETVDLTVDDGATWTPATFDGPDLGANAWRTFRATLHLPAGRHAVASRVTAANGNVQPADVAPNALGIGHNGWRGHALSVFVD